MRGHDNTSIEFLVVIPFCCLRFFLTPNRQNATESPHGGSGKKLTTVSSQNNLGVVLRDTEETIFC